MRKRRHQQLELQQRRQEQREQRQHQQQQNEQQRRHDLVRRNVRIATSLSRLASPWSEVMDLQQTFWTESHQLPQCDQHARAIRYDLLEVAEAWDRQDEESREMFVSTLAECDARIYLPTVEYPQGAMTARDAAGHRIIYWEDGYVEAPPQVFALGWMPSSVCSLRVWLTSLCCPERCHQTVCTLFGRTLCLCDTLRHLKHRK